MDPLGHDGRRSRLAHCGAAHKPMNTTKLIAQWTMAGEGHDVGGRFRATDDIRAVIAGDKSAPEPAMAGASSLMIKGTNEDSWRTLDA